MDYIFKDTPELLEVKEILALGDSVEMDRSKLLDNGDIKSISYNLFTISLRASMLNLDLSMDLTKPYKAKVSLVEKTSTTSFPKISYIYPDVVLETPKYTPNEQKEFISNYKKVIKNKISIKKGDFVKIQNGREGQITKNSSNKHIEISFKDGGKEIITIEDIIEKLDL